MQSPFPHDPPPKVSAQSSSSLPWQTLTYSVQSVLSLSGKLKKQESPVLLSCDAHSRHLLQSSFPPERKLAPERGIEHMSRTAAGCHEPCASDACAQQRWPLQQTARLASTSTCTRDSTVSNIPSLVHSHLLQSSLPPTRELAPELGCLPQPQPQTQMMIMPPYCTTASDDEDDNASLLHDSCR